MRRSLIEAVRARPLLALGPVAVITAAAMAAALLSSATYSSSTRLSVARIDATSSTAPGFQDGVANVANAYARMVDSAGVLDETAARLDVSEADLRGRITAVALPDSPMFDITATGDSPEQAQRTADAAANALRTEIARLTAANPDADRLFQDFQVASRQVAGAEAAVTAARAAADRTGTGRARERYVRAQARRDAVRLRADAVGELYRQSISGTSSADVIQILNPAGPAWSDRRTKLVRFTVVGLVSGGLLGLALAMAAPPRPGGRRPMRSVSG